MSYRLQQSLTERRCVRRNAPSKRSENPLPFSCSTTIYRYAETDCVSASRRRRLTTVFEGVRYYGYRYYNPGLGRWINRDPIYWLYPSGLYLYLANNPIEGTDYLGLVLSESDLVGLIGDIVGSGKTSLVGSLIGLKHAGDEGPGEARIVVVDVEWKTRDELPDKIRSSEYVGPCGGKNPELAEAKEFYFFDPNDKESANFEIENKNGQKINNRTSVFTSVQTLILKFAEMICKCKCTEGDANPFTNPGDDYWEWVCEEKGELTVTRKAVIKTRHTTTKPGKIR